MDKPLDDKDILIDFFRACEIQITRMHKHWAIFVTDDDGDLHHLKKEFRNKEHALAYLINILKPTTAN